MLKIITATLATLGLTVSAFECPHDGIKHEKAVVTYGMDLGCGSVRVNFRGVQIGGPGVGCPSFALITPPRDVPEHRPGSNTWVSPANKVTVTLLMFTCASDYFLFIPISTYCQQTGSRNIGQLTSYIQLPCDPQVVERGDGTAP